MEICEQHHNFKPCLLQVTELIDCYKVTEVDLTARFVPCVNTFIFFFKE